MADSAQDRKLPASQRKIEKARADGQVARSRDLGHFTAVTGGVALLLALAPELSDWMTRLLATGMRFDAALLSHPEAMLERLLDLSVQMFAVLAPLFATMVVVALASGMLSGGWNFTFKPLLPDFSKLNPLSGLGRVFSIDQLSTT